MTSQPVVRASSIRKAYGATVAVDDVSLEVHQGGWKGEPWSAHVGDVAALVAVFAICTALSARVFRWE